MRASLLASAIASMLRWSRFDACSIHGHKPRIAALGRRARTTCAACTNSVLRYLLPRLEILPRIVRSPVDSCFGTSPSQAPKSRPCLKPAPLPIAATTALVQPTPVLRKIGNNANHSWRERASLRAQDLRQRLAQGHYALPHNDAAFDEEAADLVDHTRTLADEARAHAMQSQKIHLLGRLDRHKMHGWPLHGFRNRLRIAVVVLVSLEERLHVLRRDQTHIVASGLQLPADVMGTRTGLHADQAARNIGQTAFELTTGYLLLQDDCTPLVEADEVERVLAEVDPDRGDDPSCLLRCTHRMLLEPCFTPPTSVQEIRPLSAAGPSH